MKIQRHIFEGLWGVAVGRQTHDEPFLVICCHYLFASFTGCIAVDPTNSFVSLNEIIRPLCTPDATMGKLPSAFFLIKDKLAQYCQRLQSIPRCPFWIHETVLANYLGLPRGFGAVPGQSEALTSLIASIKKGGGGNKKKRQWVDTGIPYADLFSKCNELNIYFITASRDESFPRGRLAEELLKRRP